MLIGVDFDNTIVCFDQLLHATALQAGWIDGDVAARKQQVRQRVRQQMGEPYWVELQGRVYGQQIEAAPPFPGALEFFNDCRRRGIELCVISHRTRRPARGPDVDLHQAARRWLQQRGFCQPAGPLAADRIFFELTRQEKCRRIAAVGCTHFIDDLPELFGEPEFPPAVQPILFDPHRQHAGADGVTVVHAWSEVLPLLLTESCRP